MHKSFTLGLVAISAAATAASGGPAPVSRLAPQQGEHNRAFQPPQQTQRGDHANMAVPAHISGAIAQWQSLRQRDSWPFSSYAQFLTRYRGWPGETGLRRSAERAIDPITGGSPAEVVAYFRIHPPLTNTGRARHAVALNAQGRTSEARIAAREAWRSGDLLKADEDRLLALFGSSLTAVDHDTRVEMLLDSGDAAQRATAQRLLPWTSPARRQIYDTRIAIQTRAPDADARLSALGATADAEPGIVLDRAIALRNASASASARGLLARPRTLARAPANADKWLETLLVMARGAAADRNWQMAYQIASQLGTAYPAGTDVSDRPFGERDKYTDLAWLAGTSALHRLNRPGDAARMFELYAKAARSPQTRAKGFYWAGRASTGAPSQGYFAEAARYPDQFYGQLASERIGRPIQAPPATAPTVPSRDARFAFERRDLVAATRLLGQMGRHDDQSLFIRALSEQVTGEEDRQLATEFGSRIGRPDLGVWVARSARTTGDSFYVREGFPQVSMPPSYHGQWSLAHGITRQESSFDRAAVSHAGARGMMQLMPGTANETARKMGMSYDRGRLTSDPQYNIMLGSAFFAQLMQRYGNFAPLAVAAYNAGPGNVNKWLAANGDPRMPGVDVLRWIEEIPFFETRNYVQRVLENAVVYDTINPARPGSSESNRLSFYLGKSSRPG